MIKKTENEQKDNPKHTECKSIISELKEQLKKLDLQDQNKDPEMQLLEQRNRKINYSSNKQNQNRSSQNKKMNTDGNRNNGGNNKTNRESRHKKVKKKDILLMDLNDQRNNQNQKQHQQSQMILENMSQMTNSKEFSQHHKQFSYHSPKKSQISSSKKLTNLKSTNNINIMNITKTTQSLQSKQTFTTSNNAKLPVLSSKASIIMNQNQNVNADKQNQVANQEVAQKYQDRLSMIHEDPYNIYANTDQRQESMLRLRTKMKQYEALKNRFSFQLQDRKNLKKSVQLFLTEGNQDDFDELQKMKQDSQIKKIELEFKNKYMKQQMENHLSKCQEEFGNIRQILSRIRVKIQMIYILD